MMMKLQNFHLFALRKNIYSGLLYLWPVLAITFDTSSHKAALMSLELYKCIINNMGLDYNARVKIPLKDEKIEQCLSQFFENLFSSFDSCFAKSNLSKDKVTTSVNPE